MWGLTAIAWAFIGLVVLGFIAGALTFGLASSPVITPVLAIMVLTALAAFMRSRRRAHAEVLLHYVHQAVRLNLPLPPMLRAAEAAETGRLRARITRLRQRLENGLPLGRALDLAAPDTPHRTLATVDAAEQFGRLPEALARLTTPRTDLRQSQTTSMQLRWYPVVLLVLCVLTINAFMIFVMPKFHEIFKDFKVALPPLTRAMVRFWSDFGLILTFGIVAMFALYCGQMAARMLAPRSAGVGPIRPLFDRLLWLLPVARGVTLSRGLGDGFHIVADALEGGATLPRALSEAASVPSNVVVRHRLADWAAETAKGTPTLEAARKARMPELVRGMLTNADLSPQTAGIFRFLARYYDARFSRAATLLEGAALPALSLLFGLIVGGIVLSVMLPLIQLVQGVEKWGLQ